MEQDIRSCLRRGASDPAQALRGRRLLERSGLPVSAQNAYLEEAGLILEVYEPQTVMACSVCQLPWLYGMTGPRCKGITFPQLCRSCRSRGALSSAWLSWLTDSYWSPACPQDEIITHLEHLGDSEDWAPQTTQFRAFAGYDPRVSCNECLSMEVVESTAVRVVDPKEWT